MGLTCPAPELLDRFLLGQASIEEWKTLAAHVEHCAECSVRLRDVTSNHALLQAVQNIRGAAPLQATVVEHWISQKVEDRLSETEGATSLSVDTPSAVPPGDAIDNLPSSLLAPAVEPDELGRLGPYRVLGMLGRGGMGVVFLAEDPSLHRKVALKALAPALTSDASARQRFLHEARTAAALEHDHIVTIYQVGEDRGVPFLAMPLLKGETLERRLRREGRLPVAEVLRIGREIAEGLAAAHKQGVIHRDIKPSNVWLESRDFDKPRQGDKETGRQGERGDGAALSLSPCLPVSLSSSSFRVKILDFGLARALSGDAEFSHSGFIRGTPAYMAPEQAKGHPPDARSDLFSLGCVLYRLATGESPFKGPDTMSTLLAVALRDPPPPHQCVADLPQGLSDYILQLLAKDPAWRPASAVVVAETLAALEADPSGFSSRVDTQIRATNVTQLVVPAGKVARPRRWLFAAALFLPLAVLLAVVVALAVGVLHLDPADSKKQTPAQAADLESPAAAWARRIGSQVQKRDDKMLVEFYDAYSSVENPEATFGQPLTGIQPGWEDAKYIGFEKGEIIFNPNSKRAYAIYGEIFNAYHAYRNPGSIFGHPLSSIQTGWRGAVYIAFEKGEIILNPNTKKAHALDGEIYRAYHALDNRCFFLGQPTSPIQPGYAGAFFIAFENGQIILHPKTQQAHAVFGKIFDAYIATPDPGGRFGHPLTGVTVAENGRDRFVRFENGMLYWDAGTDRVTFKE
jgi:serine/threonine protein kinase